MTLREWVKHTKASPCPVCGKPSCSSSPDGEKVSCWRVQGNGRPTASGAYLHTLVERSDWQPPKDREVEIEIPPDWTSHARRLAMLTDDSSIEELSGLTHVPARALRRQMVCWSNVYQAWGWPMWWILAGVPRVVGMRTRYRSGAKRAVSGSRSGLFMPADFLARRDDHEVVVVCEGATDTGIALSMGFLAIGLPSASGSIEMAAKACAGKKVLIIPDPGDAGERSAISLEGALRPCCPAIAIMEPPEGQDLREWSQDPNARVHIESFINVLGGVA